METIPLDEAARDLPGLIARLRPGERVAITDAAGTVVLDAARPAASDDDLVGLDAEDRAWFERWDALAERVGAAWQGPDAVETVREGRER